MPDSIVTHIPIETRSSLKRHQSAWTALLLCVVVAAATTAFTRSRLNPLRREYLPGYLRAAVEWKKSDTYTFYELQYRGKPILARAPDVQHLDGQLVISDAANARHLGPLRKVPHFLPTEEAYGYIRLYIFDDHSVRHIFRFPILATILAFFGIPFASTLDARTARRRQQGIVRRGPRILPRHQFNRSLRSDGIGFRVEGFPALAELLLEPRWRRRTLRIPASAETSHILIMGDSGTGKSVLLRQLLREIVRRGEVAIVYDPAGEFLAEFYNPDRGDVILNPLDARSPFWSPSDELLANAEALTLAESIFPDTNSENQFFVRAPRQILAHLLQYQPTPAELVSWLMNPDEIDLRVQGTEMAAMLSKGAGAQRAGVLASLGIALTAFRLLPEESDCTTRWTAQNWAETRRGWIFLTTTSTTRKAQLPLVSMWLDTLILRLLSRIDHRDTTTPVWMVIDELASLQKLPQLETALTEARKYQVKMVLGLQGKSQLQQRYGEKGAETIVSQAHTKIFFRTNEPNAADWISRSLGDQEIAREKVNQSQSSNNRTTKGYTIDLSTERAVSAAQIQGLPSLTGYIKYENSIAGFRIPVVRSVARVPPLQLRPSAGFVPLATPGPYEVSDPDQILAQQPTLQQEAGQHAADPATGSPEPPAFSATGPDDLSALAAATETHETSSASPDVEDTSQSREPSGDTGGDPETTRDEFIM